MARLFLWLAVLSTSLMGAVACASSKTHLIPPDVTAGDTSETTLSVQNNGFPDMDMYVIRDDGTRYRLGTALGNQTTVLVIPKFMLIGAVTNLHFVADPVNGRRASVSQTLSVSPGDEIDMIIPPS